jgi:hypothetical protein
MTKLLLITTTFMMISLSAFATGYLQAGSNWNDSSCYSQCTSLDGTSLQGTGQSYNGNYSYAGSGRCICYGSVLRPNMPPQEQLRIRAERLKKQCKKLRRPAPKGFTYFYE